MIGLSDELYKKIAEIISDKIGIIYTLEQKNTMNNRLMPLLISYKLESFQDLYSLLSSYKDEKFIMDLIDRVTTNHTYFYREDAQFNYFNSSILPEFEKRCRVTKQEKLKFWIAACSTGEEAYTLAMIGHNYFYTKGQGIPFSILATDVSRRAIGIAEKGIYKNSEIGKLPQKFKNIYFQKSDQTHCKICKEISSLVLFRVLNIVRNEFPFRGKFDIIFLRNVMIYFNEEVKYKLIQQMENLLNDGGYLFIGLTESIPLSFKKIKFVQPSIYRKN